jgi:hypothetical protein
MVLWVDRGTAYALAVRQPAWRFRFAALGAPLSAVVSVLVWNWWSAQQLSDARTASKLSLAASLSRSARETTITLREVAGSLGWLEFSSPTWTQALWWMVVAFAGCLVWRQGRRRFRGWLMIVVLMLVSPVIFETLLAHRIGFVWQGRYSIATALGLVVVAIDSPLPARLIGLPSQWLIAVTAFSIEVGAYWYALRRYTVGTNGSWFFRHLVWHPPAAPFLLVALNAALMAALLALQRWLGSAPSSIDRNVGTLPVG